MSDGRQTIRRVESNGIAAEAEVEYYSGMSRLFKSQKEYRPRTAPLPVFGYDRHPDHGATKSGPMTFLHYERVKVEICRYWI